MTALYSRPRLALMLPCTLFIAGCSLPEQVEIIPLRLNTDLSVLTVESATCTRGEKPFTLKVDANGSGTGRLVDVKPWVDFPASLTVKDSKTVTLGLNAGDVTDEAISEDLSSVVTGGKVVLRGDTFDCRNVFVREIQ